MRSAIIGFAVGAMLLQWQSDLPSLPVLLALPVAACGLWLAVRRARHASGRVAGALVIGAALGFAWAAGFAHYYLQHALPAEWEGRDITVVGTIDSLPDRFARGTRFNFLVEQAFGDGRPIAAVPPKIALSWYGGVDDGSPAPAVSPAERWRFKVRLQRPHGNANPFGFDYEVWLLEQDIRATGYVRPEGMERLVSFVPGLRNAIQYGRHRLRERILAMLPERPYAGVIVALVVGDQRAIGQSDWDIFNRTGTSHLIAISGLHITMVAGLFAGLVFRLWRRSFFTGASLPLWLPAQKAAALAGAVAALVYVALAGFGVPAQRTLYMVAVVAAALWSGRIAGVSHVLCAALGAVVLLDPWAVLWPGFWLSFGAVALILYTSVGRIAMPARRPQWRRSLHAAVRTQYAVTLGLVPLTMLLFGQISLIGPIANAVAIPLISFIVTPLALVGSMLPVPLAGWVLGAAHGLVAWLAAWLGWLGALPLAVWQAPVPKPWIFAVALVGTLWLLAPRGWPLRWLGLAGWLPLLLNAPTHPDEGTMRVTAFDIGQGTAVLIETARHRLLYDTGPAYSPEADGGSRVIVPYLRARGISALDGVVISHSDLDHAGGALSVFEAVKVGWVASSLPTDAAIVRAAPAHRRCVAGQAWQWDGVRFEMLHPVAASYDSAKWKPNARSCTLKITLGAQAIVLAGDIEAVQEAELVEAMPERLRASVLLAPHHGSGTSSTMPFLAAVQPDIALFQVGYRNRYRHPKAEVYERYGRLGIRRLRSDETGAVTLHVDGGIRAELYRFEHAHYWYGR